MILDAILLALAEIASTQQKEVVILPGMRIAPGDGIQISHPVSGYGLWLSGNVDYAVIEYEDVMDNKGESIHQILLLEGWLYGFLRRLLAPGGSREDAFKIAKGSLFLVEAKRQGSERTLVSYVPEAVGQAIALLKSAKVRQLCLLYFVW